MKKMCILIALIFVVGCSEKAEETSTTAIDVPEFTLHSTREEPVRLSEYRDQTVLLVFWATWCPYCKAEIPRLKEIHEEYGDKDLTILALSIDNNKEKLKEFVAENDIPYTVLFDEGTETAQAYGVVGVPAHYVVDTDGRGYLFGPNLELAVAMADSLLNN